MRESTVEDYLKAKARSHGGGTRKVKWLDRRGAPDRLVLLCKRHFLVETKATGEEAEAHQLREHDRLRAAGFDVYIADTVEKVDALPWLS